MNEIRRIPEVWAENRDEIFVNRLADDIGKLQQAGFDDKDIPKMLCTLSYVRFWVHWPTWAFPADKLPKGYKWADGLKFRMNGGKRMIGESYTFLPAGDDLYIKGKPLDLVGTNIHDKAFLRIIDFRMLTAIEFLEGIEGGTPFFCNCVMKFWKENGGRIGGLEPLRKPKNPSEAKEMWDMRKELMQIRKEVDS